MNNIVYSFKIVKVSRTTQLVHVMQRRLYRYYIVHILVIDIQHTAYTYISHYMKKIV